MLRHCFLSMTGIVTVLASLFVMNLAYARITKIVIEKAES
jgi:hypothetical protein